MQYTGYNVLGHKNWNKVTNLVWILLYPGVILANLFTDGQYWYNVQIRLGKYNEIDKQVDKETVNLRETDLKAGQSTNAQISFVCGKLR